ncbi:MAG: hypothetical protein ABI333_04295 [bacterium]
MVNHNPQPPGHPAGQQAPDFHDAVSATTPTAVVKAAGGLQVGAGLLLALSGVQLLISVTFYKPWMEKVPYAMMLFGIAAMLTGLKTLRMQGWAALAGTALNGLISLLMGYWVMLTLGGGFFSLIASLVPALALAGTVLGALSISPALRADKARQVLRDSGIDMEF